MKRPVVKWLTVGVVLLLGYVGLLLNDAGVFKTLVPHGAESCQTIQAPGLVGAEDLVVAADGSLFISGNDRLNEGGESPGNGPKAPTGTGIFVLSPGSSTPLPVALPAQLAAHLRPHGMDLYTAPGRSQWLYVIDHHDADPGQATGDQLVVFQVTPPTLNFIRTVPLPYPNANDLLVWDKDHVYVTFDHKAATPLGRKIEDYSRRGRGFVGVYDGGTWREAASGIAYTNGIARLADGKHIAVAAMLGRSYTIYTVTNDSMLQEERTVNVGSGIDNMTVDTSGTLWLAAHPQLLKLKAMSKDRSQRAPAQVFKVVNPLAPGATPEEVFLDDGSKIAAVSVALHTDHKLILGSVFDDRLLVCPQP